MARKLTSNVHVITDEKTGAAQWFGPDYPDAGEPPSGSVTNEAAYADPDAAAVDLRFRAEDFEASGQEPVSLREDETSTSSSDDGAPPRHGAGSGKEAWATYAAGRGLDVPEDATRDDIIAAVDAAS